MKCRWLALRLCNQKKNYQIPKWNCNKSLTHFTRQLKCIKIRPNSPKTKCKTEDGLNKVWTFLNFVLQSWPIKTDSEVCYFLTLFWPIFFKALNFLNNSKHNQRRMPINTQLLDLKRFFWNISIKSIWANFSSPF